MYFALSLSLHVKVHSKQYTNYVSSIIFDGFVDLQNESATILGTFCYYLVIPTESQNETWGNYRCL